jgi:asparagine synthase (glutamine-hydrolysing)
MSFIFGIINLDHKPVLAEELLALSNTVKWEGALAQTTLDGNVGLGFCHYPGRKHRAGIFRDEKLIVLADIRIYNAEGLKRSFDFTSPEEAFAKAYRHWGLECAVHINGDFASVVIDRTRNEVHLFRDHIGTRPLTYWFSGNRLIFASHEFGLAKSGLFECALSEECLINRLFRYRGKYSQTVFQDIRKVTPGHSVSFSVGREQALKYWRPEDILKNKAISFEDSATRLQELIVKATLNRMEPGKTGMHVSGGLDSCGIASIVADHVLNKSLLTGYSWTPEVFDDATEGVNEKVFIDAFSEDKKVPVRYLRLEEYEAVKDAIIPEFENQHIEHPVMQMAEKDGIEILFSGWGGDEFVSLTTRGTVNHLFFSLKLLGLIRYINKTGIRSMIHQFRTDVIPFLVPFGLVPVYKAGGSTDWSTLHLLKPPFIRKHWKQIFLHRHGKIFGYGDRTRFALNLLELYHLPERMDSWAINAERYGFEYRYPLLDKDLLEFWFSLPAEYTYRDFYPRLLFREAMKGILTEEIRLRKNKQEALRIAYSLREGQNGKKYLKELFLSLPEQDHLPFFRPEAFPELIDRPPSNYLLKNIRVIHKLTTYFRYVALVKRYITR